MFGHALGQGQVVSLVLVVVGFLVLLAVGVRRWRTSQVVAVARWRAVVAGALLVMAGLALLLVRRLDPAALSRVLAGLSAALVAHAALGQARPGASYHLAGVRGDLPVSGRRRISIPALRRELS